MDFKVNREDSTAHFTFLQPKLDFYLIRNMEKDLIKEFDNCNKIVFNMENTEIIASAFIRLCLEAVQRVGKENFEIVKVNKFVKTVLHISKFDNFVKVSE